MLGMCGGLRRRYKIGEYLVPVASIRAEGTSDFYFPPEVPALGNFLMQKAVTEVLQEEGHNYHIGLTFTTNKRFWEYNEEFKDRLKATRAQAIELECATLFTASYKCKFTLGALLLISDLPLAQVKTKRTSEFGYETFMPNHVEMGVKSCVMLAWRRDATSRVPTTRAMISAVASTDNFIWSKIKELAILALLHELGLMLL